MKLWFSIWNVDNYSSQTSSYNNYQYSLTTCCCFHIFHLPWEYIHKVYSNILDVQWALIWCWISANWLSEKKSAKIIECWSHRYLYIYGWSITDWLPLKHILLDIDQYHNKYLKQITEILLAETKLTWSYKSERHTTKSIYFKVGCLATPKMCGIFSHFLAL